MPFEHTVRRSLSGYLRPEICMKSLLHLSKRGFESMPSIGKLKETAVIKKLLRGEQVKISDFEKELAPLKQINNTFVPYTFSDLLEYHKFSRGDTAYYFPKAYQSTPLQSLFGKKAARGKITGINTGEDGSIRYIFENSSGRQTALPALNLWSSEEVFVASAAKEERNLKKLKEEVEKAKQQKQLKESAEKKAAENAAARQREAEQARMAANLARKIAEEKEVRDNRQTFVDLKDEIAALDPSKREVVGYEKHVTIKLTPEPPQGSEVAKWQNKSGTVKKVQKTSKDGKDYLSVWVQPDGIYWAENIQPRWFRLDFISKYEKPVKKGGRRKTRANRKSKRRTTRRANRASKY
jgi:hypothetical protein